MALLEIRNLTIEFETTRGVLRAVEGLDLDVEPGEALGIVGESGSGKSVSLLAAMGLLPPTARVRADRLAFDGRELATLGARERRRINGGAMAMIFQEPMTSLNPCFTVGFQIVEALREHDGISGTAARSRAADLLSTVGIPDPAEALKRFPHQLSGGMNQRVMIAMAIACRPRLLLADEPTTALDVTIQAQILDLLAELRRAHGMALVLVTHDIGVVAEIAERVVVMYAGQALEADRVETILARPRHPYAAALLAALPERSHGSARLATIPGTVASLLPPPRGCRFAERCAHADARCRDEAPVLTRSGSTVIRCHKPLGARDA
ncbi:MAG: ABC transporter ATP-binding protein [Alphaproteobacteria bacterium]|nr:ABC transporter ATP-binding protein [Alphaproteobacteria bacterium]